RSGEARAAQRLVDLSRTSLQRGLSGPRQVCGGGGVDRNPQDEKNGQRDRAAPGDEPPANPPQQANVALGGRLVSRFGGEERPESAHGRASTPDPSRRSCRDVRSGASSR